MKHPVFPLSAILAALAAPVLLGLSPIFVRFTEAGPITVAFYRTLISLPILGVWTFCKDQSSTSKMSWKEIALLIGAGFFFSCDLGFWNVSLLYTTVVNSTLINNLCAFFIPLILYFLYSHRLTPLFLSSLVCASIGIGFLSGEEFTLSSEGVKGDSFALVSAIALSAYYVVVSILRGSHSSVKILFWSSIPCTLFLLLFALLRGESLLITDANTWWLLVIQSLLVYIGGQGLLSYAMGHISAAFVGLTLLVCPAVAAIASWILFGESLSLFQTFGVLLVLGSIAVAKQSKEEGVPVVE